MGANQLQTTSNYNLRYCYLRMQGNTTTSDFTYLDSIFITHRNPNAIQQMQQKVADYEQVLQRQAELLLHQKQILREQSKLKDFLEQWK